MSRAKISLSNSVVKAARNNSDLKQLPVLIQNDVAIAIAQKSLPFTAGKTMLNTATKVITTLVGNKIIPSHEIQKARQLGLCNIAALADKVAYLYAPIKKNQYEPEERLILSRVQISRKIINIGMEIIKN